MSFRTAYRAAVDDVSNSRLIDVPGLTLSPFQPFPRAVIFRHAMRYVVRMIDTDIIEAPRGSIENALAVG